MLQASFRSLESALARLLICLVVHGGAVIAADYEREIKPVLEEKCYACHGALQQAGGLRVDTAAALIRGGDSGETIEPGDPDASLLIGVLTGEAGFQMPPAGEGSPLSDDQLQTVRAWIRAGAKHPIDETPQQDPASWWSYQPLRRPEVPEAEPQWCRNPIDQFVAAKRNELGLPYTGEADKQVWLRRVHLDLIGIPPSRQEQLDFIRDDSPLAHERVVDDLLSRPQYGERWGRHWMDIWRYSDWYGSRGINEIRYSQRHIWRWRDWIIRSLNHDKGYDRMIHEMLAGDEIGNGDPSIMAATGFLGRNWYKFDRDAWLFETVERTSEAFLGLTMRCARCHDHKFDPITQHDYYRFRAIFEPHDVRTDPLSALAPREKDATLGEVLSDGIATVYDKTLDAVTYRLERGDSRHPDKSIAIQPGVPTSLGGDFDVQPIVLPAATWYPALRPSVRQSLLEQAEQQMQASQERLRMATAALVQAGIALEQHQDSNADDLDVAPLLTDDFHEAQPQQWEVVSGDWQYRDGHLVQATVTNFATMVSQQAIRGDFRVRLRYRPLAPGRYRSVGFSFDWVDTGNSQDVYTSTGDEKQSVQAFHRIDGQPFYPASGIVPTELAVGELSLLEASVRGSRLAIDLNGKRMLDYTLPVPRREGRFAIWVHDGVAEFHELEIQPLPVSRETLASKLEDARRNQAIADAEHDLAIAERNSLELRLAADSSRYEHSLSTNGESWMRQALAAERDAAVCKAKLAVVKSAGASSQDQSKAAKALNDALAAAQHPEGDFSSVGTRYPSTSSGRRTALARWLTSPQHPRTARIAVNHMWNRHFGVPLVDTTENFGLNGRTPTHPQLLDWLACELVASDWSMKRLHKLMVLSATYRMASSWPAPSAIAAGRESAMAVDQQNRYYWRMNSRRMEAEVVRDATLHLSGKLDLAMGGAELDESNGESIARRSLYFRNTPNENMLLLDVFDIADPNACYRRKESIIPQQSLAMMNSGLVQDAAKTLARSLAAEADFVGVAFETVLSRPPREDERRRCEAFLLEHAALVREQTDERFTEGGTAKLTPATDPLDRAHENLVHVLLLHHDFVTIR